MNPREQFLVERLVERLATQPAQPIDADAQRELDLLLRRRQDAPYLLMQRALQLEEALKLAYEEIEQLRRRGSARPAPDANAFGRSSGADPAARQAAPGAGPAGAGLAGSAVMPAAGGRPGAGMGAPGVGGLGMGGSGLVGGAAGGMQGGAGVPGGMMQPPAAPGAGGSFLRSAGAVAAGVVGGSLLFHGIENLMSPHGSGLLSNNDAGASGDTASSLAGASGADAGGAGFTPLADAPGDGGMPADYAQADYAPADSGSADYAPTDYAADDGSLGAVDDAGSWDDGGDSGGDWA